MKERREIDSSRPEESRADQMDASSGDEVPVAGRGTKKERFRDRDASINTDIYRDVNRALPA